MDQLVIIAALMLMVIVFTVVVATVCQGCEKRNAPDQIFAANDS